MINYLVFPRSGIKADRNFIEPEDNGEVNILLDAGQIKNAEDIDRFRGRLASEFKSAKIHVFGTSSNEKAFTSIYDFLRSRYPSNSKGFVLDFPGDIKYIKELRWFIHWIVVKSGGESREAFKFEIIVDELCLNAIEHGLESGPVYFSFSNNGDNIKIVVKNRPRGNPDMAEINAKLEKFDVSGEYMGEKGRGLFIVKNLADSLDFKSDEDGSTVVTAVKRIEIRG